MKVQTPVGAMDPVEVKLLTGMTVQDMNNMMKLPENQEQQKKFMLLTMEIAKASSWEVAHKQSVQFLEVAQSTMLEFSFAQQIAHFMLRKHLLNTESEMTEEKLSAIEYYTNSLVKYKSFADRVVFAQALMQLQGKWQPETVKALAKECLTSGATTMPRHNFDIDKIKRMNPEERKNFFVNEMVNKQKIPREEALMHAEMMEKVHQDRIKNGDNPQMQRPQHLPPEMLQQEQAVKTLARLAGEKFTSYEERIAQENNTKK